MFFAPWSIPVSAALMVSAALALLFLGVRFARVVDAIADRTGMGEALAGAILLGATTSLPGLATTAVGAAQGDASFAVSNGVGGIAAQTVFIAIADLSYRNANLEHAAASTPNLLQALLLIILGALVLVAITAPGLSWAGTHAVTPVLALAYGWGLVLVRQARSQPMWSPLRTSDTRSDEPDPEHQQASLSRLWREFALMSLLVGFTGIVVGHAGTSLVASSPLSSSLVGGVFTSVVTSLPELVTVLAAVRMGALTLAVGDIIGGNTFDVLFLFVADLIYRRGPIYADVDAGARFLVALMVLMTAVLATGFVVRQRSGIGFEGVSLLALYGLGIAALTQI